VVRATRPPKTTAAQTAAQTAAPDPAVANVVRELAKMMGDVVDALKKTQDDLVARDALVCKAAGDAIGAAVQATEARLSARINELEARLAKLADDRPQKVAIVDLPATTTTMTAERGRDGITGSTSVTKVAEGVEPSAP